MIDGETDGEALIDAEAEEDGEVDGTAAGLAEGETVGLTDGLDVGDIFGLAVGEGLSAVIVTGGGGPNDFRYSTRSFISASVNPNFRKSL